MPRTILVVDDDETHRILARDCLEAEGYRILEAGDGEAGLRMLREEDADLVLLDVMMPGRDGYSVCQDIRSDPNLAEMPVIMVTGVEDLAAVHRVFSVKADDFVTKPVHWQLLPYRIRFALRRRDDEITLREALAKSRAADEAKAEFLAAMGHELRTPLNAIIGFSEIIANNALGPGGAQKYTEYANHVFNSGKRLLNLINAILDSVKLQNKQLLLNLRSVRMDTHLDFLSGKLAALCAAAGHRLEMRYDPGLPAVQADPDRINQIVENLVSNAVKFTPPGGAIEAAALYGPDGGVEIRITDTGIGMSEDEIATALEPFRQVDGSLARRHEGAGLGLSIAKGLAELHSAVLSIESAKGLGTVVKVRFPPPAQNRENTRVAAA